MADIHTINTPAPELVARAVALYPEALRAGEHSDATRFAFHIDLVRSLAPVGGKVMDVGGGMGAFCPALALAGLQVTLVDDLLDPINHEWPIEKLGAHRATGVEVMAVDASSDAFDPPYGFDVITSFDSIEHWHRSPKRALHKIAAALKPGGYLVLGLPNCVNLRKRITVPLGYGKWSSMQAWYEEPIFRSHVREPDVDDLRYIARDLALTEVKIFGRNWAGYANRRKFIRNLTRFVDHPLRLMPSLCSDLYLIGRKPLDG